MASDEVLVVDEPRSGRGKSLAREVLETLLLTLIVFLAVRALVQNFKVEGSSMEPNLHDGQYLLVNKISYWGLNLRPLARLLPSLATVPEAIFHPFGTPQRGDVVVFHFPRDPQRDFIKRIVGMPGETVEIRSGTVYINSAQLEEPYIRERPRYNLAPQRVPQDSYFVLGDNRNNSSDSHVWGVVPRANIIGKAWLVYWPLADWGIAPNFSLASSP